MLTGTSEETIRKNSLIRMVIQTYTNMEEIDDLKANNVLTDISKAAVGNSLLRNLLTVMAEMPDPEWLDLKTACDSVMQQYPNILHNVTKHELLYELGTGCGSLLALVCSNESDLASDLDFKTKYLYKLNKLSDDEWAKLEFDNPEL